MRGRSEGTGVRGSQAEEGEGLGAAEWPQGCDSQTLRACGSLRACGVPWSLQGSSPGCLLLDILVP